MKKILLPVDGSENSQRAIEFAVTQLHSGANDEIHLLNVQLPIHTGFAKQQDIEKYQTSEAEKSLAAARKLLEDKGVTFIEHIAVGQIAEAIAHYAKTQKIDQIIMGTRGLGTVSGLILGSVATKVLHLANCPVTLVK